MTIKTEEQYLEEGLAAVREYDATLLAEKIDTIIVENEESLHFRGTGNTFKSKVIELDHVFLGGKKAIMSFMNKNKYNNSALKFIDSYVSEHPDEIQEIIQKIESDMKMPLSQIGFDRNLYDKLLEAIPKKGLIGNSGASGIVFDEIMEHLPDVVQVSSNILGSEDVFKGMTFDDVGEFLNTNLGMSVEGVQESYNLSNGLFSKNGVLKYLMDNTIINGVPHLEDTLVQLKNQGVDHDLTSEIIVDKYQENGLLGNQGLVEILGRAALESYPNSELIIYSKILSSAGSEKKKALKEDLKGKLGFMGHIKSDDIEKLVEQKFAESVQTVIQYTEFPSAISKKNLLEVYDNHGLFGEEGVISYISNNSESILANAKKTGLLDDDDVKSFTESTKSVGNNLNSLKDILSVKVEKTDMEKYFIGLAMKAEELDITPKNLLNDSEYLVDLKDVIVEVYGSVDKKYQPEMIESIVPYLDKGLSEIKSGKINQEVILNSIDELRLEGFFREAVDALAAKYVKKTVVQRVEDYLTLTKALIEVKAEYSRNRLNDFKALEA